MKKSQTPWEAISAYLNNRSDKESEAIIKTWLKESPDNIHLLKEVVDTLQITHRNVEFYQPDKDKLWDELVGRIQPQSTNKSKVIRLSILKYAAVAAVVAMAFLAGKFYNFNANQTDDATAGRFTSVETELGQRSHVVLPDGTKVWLNSGSEVKYAADFNSNTRDVYISGECYFEVTKNKHRPFVVHANDLQVKVYGTHFNVKENEKHGQAEVTLVEGKVEVLDKNNKSLTYLNPREQLTLKDQNYQVKVAENPDALIAWTEGILIFEDKPFEEVAEYLECWYGVSIKLGQDLHNNHRYTFKVKTESLREVLDLISVITPIQYKIEGEQVSINLKKES